MVRVAEAEMQQESCAVFLEILEQGLVPVQNYTQTFLQTILMCMENKDPGMKISHIQIVSWFFLLLVRYVPNVAKRSI